MPNDSSLTYAPATLAIRTGHNRSLEGEHSEPIFASSSYVFKNAAEAAARFSGEQPGNVYSRFTNPTVQIFEQRLAALEGGEACIATASGMSAILAVCLGLLQHGAHIVASQAIFGTTNILFNKYLTRFGITNTQVNLSDYTAWEAAIKPETRLLFLETPSNPLTEMVDIKRIATIAHAHNCLLVVDNCFCTPALQRPLTLGADLVVHSATKYLDGQGRCMGGAVVGDKRRVGEEIYGVLRTTGPTMSPFNAWVFLKGLETLNIRMQAHSSQALTLAHWLEQQSVVQQVFYPGLESHPQHYLVGTQQQDGGGILSFKVKGGQGAAWTVIDATKMLSITANLGDVKTTITHPATTTHGRLTPQERAVAGIDEGLIRIAVGLEAIQDIQRDLEYGLKQIS
ncbi:O-succinylhomoserine sulfhydrylase [Achromatium sp. WMS3]|nr:O-succinylhomoserine sulfhydrylase [Achromatium sp. WMS3]